MASYEKDKANILNRLRRIEGQVRGIQRMVEDGKYCVDVLTQLSSVIAATDKVSLIILENHIRGCVRNALAKEDGDNSMDELMGVVSRFVR